jgi:nucleoside-diphosphate-sugar epimerase
MNILVTGSLGYVGTHAVDHLISKGFSIKGIDTGYFLECNLAPVANQGITRLKDIRDLEVSDFIDIDAVVHMAALSNDPIGELDKKLTFDINYHSAVRAAELAKAAKVKRFIFISTQSIYGVSNLQTALDEDLSVKNPQTAYAQSKWKAEQEILSMLDQDFTVSALRPSTVFGWGERLRSDIVFNNLVSNGLRDKCIKVHSDGTPWRPVVHVKDLARAIEKCLTADSQMINGSAFNIGMTDGNYTINELANTASKLLGSIPVILSTETIIDPRSYKVSFEKAKTKLDFEAKVTLTIGGQELIQFLSGLDIDHCQEFDRKTNRLMQLNYLIRERVLDDNLRFKDN